MYSSMLIDVSAVLMYSLLCFVALHYTVHISFVHPPINPFLLRHDSFFPTVSTYAFFCSTFFCSSTFFFSSICSSFNCYSLRILSFKCLDSYSLFCTILGHPSCLYSLTFNSFSDSAFFSAVFS